MNPAKSIGPVLLFDGECGLCQRVVRWLLQIDRRGALCFGRLQGPAAQIYLRAHGLPTESFSSLIFVPDWPGEKGQPLLRTDGVIAALRVAGRPGLAAALAIMPRGLRDLVYKFVARVRYRVFGPWRSCPPMQSEWAARFME